MPVGLIRDPFDYDEANWRASVDSRLSQLERQPQRLAPVVQYGRPLTALSFVAPFAFTQVAVAPTFTPLWESLWSQTVHRGLFIGMKYQSTSACQFRINALDVASGTTYTLNIPSATVTLPATGGVVTSFQVRWFHPLPLWRSGVVITLYGSTTAGTAYFSPPYSGFVQIDARACTTTG